MVTTRYPDGAESIDMPLPGELATVIAGRIDHFEQLRSSGRF